MTTAAASPKFAAVSILLNRAEGLFAECGEVLLRGRFEVTPWQRAAAMVGAWQAAKRLRGDEHGDKVDYTITYDNGDEAKGTFEMDLVDTLADHIRREHRFYSGDHCPAHMTAARYDAFIASVTTPEKRAARREFLATHEIE